MSIKPRKKITVIMFFGTNGLGPFPCYFCQEGVTWEKEHRENLATRNRELWTAERREKFSIAQKARFAKTGPTTGFSGRSHTQESREQMKIGQAKRRARE